MIERSTSPGSWALFSAGEPVAGGTFQSEGSRAPSWLADLKDALDALGVYPRDIASYVTATGPGSFSGIRSTLAALQGLALPRGTPIFGVSTAALLAWQFMESEKAPHVSVFGDARRRKIWLARFEREGNQMRIAAAAPRHDCDDFELTTLEDLPSLLPQGTLVVSPDWERLSDSLSAMSLVGVELRRQAALPDARSLGALFMSNPAGARRAPLPIYLHPAVSAT